MLFRSKLIQIILCAFFAITIQTSFAHTQQHNPHIGFTAQHIKEMPGKHESLLLGDVKITVGDKIKITGEKVLVKYSHKKVAEFVIYGEGTLTSGNQPMQFKNATYNPQTGRITAQEMKRID